MKRYSCLLENARQLNVAMSDPKIPYFYDLVDLSNQIVELTETASNSFYQEQINNTLNNNKDIWCELRQLRLMPKLKSDFYGFLPDELNAHFAGVSTSSSVNLDNINELIANASNDNFKFTEVTLNDVILAVAHFSSQAIGDDDIPQRIIAKSLPTIGPLLVALFSASLGSMVFPLV